MYPIGPQYLMGPQSAYMNPNVGFANQGVPYPGTSPYVAYPAQQGPSQYYQPQPQNQGQYAYYPQSAYTQKWLNRVLQKIKW